MPATPLTPTTRYLPPGTRKYYWLTSLANPAAPTRAELNAGTDLTAEIVTGGVGGFTLARTRADVTPLGSSVIVMLDTTTDPNTTTNEIVFYASVTGSDVRQVMSAGTAGFLVFLYEGDVTGQRCEVWPAAVSVLFFDQGTETPGEIHVQYLITAQPSQNVLIP